MVSNDALAAGIAVIAGRHAGRDGALLPILHDIQAQYGAVDEAAVRVVAGLMNLSRADVHGVVSFYHDFRDVPAPLPILKLCRAEACQARGVEALVADAEALAARRVTIEPIYCLGLCSVGPAALINGAVHARLDAARLAALIAAAA